MGAHLGSLFYLSLLRPISLSPIPPGEGLGEGSQGSPKVNDVMGPVDTVCVSKIPGCSFCYTADGF